MSETAPGGLIELPVPPNGPGCADCDVATGVPGVAGVPGPRVPGPRAPGPRVPADRRDHLH